jgi:hypothetical protein
LIRSELDRSPVDRVSTLVETDEQARASRIKSLFSLVEPAQDPAEQKERTKVQLGRDVAALRWPLILLHEEALYAGAVGGLVLSRTTWLSSGAGRP